MLRIKSNGWLSWFVGLSFGVLLLAVTAPQSAFAADEDQEGEADVKTYSEANYEDALVRGAVGNLFRLIEGSFGALVMVVAGLGAIVASSMGAYRVSMSLIVTAISAFILRALVSLFFGSDYHSYGVASGEGVDLP